MMLLNPNEVQQVQNQQLQLQTTIYDEMMTIMTTIIMMMMIHHDHDDNN